MFINDQLFFEVLSTPSIRKNQDFLMIFDSFFEKLGENVDDNLELLYDQVDGEFRFKLFNDFSAFSIPSANFKLKINLSFETIETDINFKSSVAQFFFKFDNAKTLFLDGVEAPHKTLHPLILSTTWVRLNFKEIDFFSSGAIFRSLFRFFFKRSSKLIFFKKKRFFPVKFSRKLGIIKIRRKFFLTVSEILKMSLVGGKSQKTCDLKSFFTNVVRHKFFIINF